MKYSVMETTGSKGSTSRKMRIWSTASRLATLLVLQAAGAGFAAPAVLFTPSIVDAGSIKSGNDVTTKPNFPDVMEWLPKDNQTTYVLKKGEVRRLELNSTALHGVPFFITVSPCTRNLLWSVYHGLRNRPEEGLSLVREYRDGEKETFSAMVSSSDQYVVELRGAGGSEAAGALSARGERGGIVRMRLRVRSKRRLSASWDKSPIDPQATTYCVVASKTRSYSSLCAARHDCQIANCQESTVNCQDRLNDRNEYSMAEEVLLGRSFKNYVRRKKYSRSTQISEEEPVVVCVGSRNHHIIENLDFTKTYHVSVFGVGRDRSAGALLASGTVRSRAPASRPLKDGVATRVDVRDKATFNYKAKPLSNDGVWIGAITCGGAIDVEVLVKGRRLHVVRNIGPSIKFFLPSPRLTTSMQESEDSSLMDSSSEEFRIRYVIKVTLSRRDASGSIVELTVSRNRRDVLIPELDKNAGATIRELKPMSSCRSLYVAFLPVQQPAGIIRYCVAAREFQEMHHAHPGTCNTRSDSTHSRMHCADFSPNGYGKVITQRIEGLVPSRKYAISVTASANGSLPVSYSILYADTSPYCEEE